MDKSFFGTTVSRHIACIAVLVGTIFEPVQAQMISDEGMQSARHSLPVATSQQSSPMPPVIVKTKPDAQAQQLQQVQNIERKPSKANDAQDVFANYVRSVSGVQVAIFGKSLFSDVPTTFAPFESAPVNADYVIGTGDELQIRAWGMVSVDVTATVDRNGAIYIPQVGAVKVAGVRYGDLQGYLKQAVGKIFSNFELTASIAQTRAVQIYVVGHAVRPGTYTLSSMSTLLNALFTSGGPDAAGSMRNVQLKRRGETVATFDMYDMLTRGDKSHDATLRDGDVIYIPEAGPMVALTGNVKTPAIFELKGPTSLADVVAWAGGVDASAQQKKIVVEKTVDNAYRGVAEFVADAGAADKSLRAIPVQPADVIRVFAPGAIPVQAQIQREYVRVAGEVKQGGVFEIRKGETLRELMIRLGGVNESAYPYGTQLTRESVRRSQQSKLDEVAMRYEREIESAANSKIAGATDKDVIAAQGAELERERRVAQQLRSIKAEGRIVLELDDGNAQLRDLPDLPLQDGDSIFVPRRPGTVDVLGAVFQSNSFIYKKNRTVKDYIQLAGGETDSADSSEVYVIRADGVAKSSAGAGFFSSLNGTTLNPGDTIVVPEKVERTSWRQSLKEWTSIFYQFGLGAAGLKVLKN